MPDNENASGGGLDISMLSGLLSNPEIMSKVSSVLSSLTATAESSPPSEKKEDVPVHGSASPLDSNIAEKLSSVMENKELMSKLPDIMATLGPMLSPGGGKGGGHSKKESCDKRTALLLALKPYMSPRRCEAIDYIVRINRLGDVIKNIT